MKVSSFSTMIILLTISSFLFIPPIQCTIPNQDSIQEICQNTPNYSLCLLTLKSKENTHALRNSQSNDKIAGYVYVTLDVVVGRVPLLIEQLHEVDAQTDHTQLKAALDDCIASYTKISKEIMPQALAFVDKGDLNGAKDNAILTKNLTDSCEKKCKDATSSAVSPLGGGSKYVQDLCGIAVSIITQFSQSKKQTIS